jgi:hypothetical protein
MRISPSGPARRPAYRGMANKNVFAIIGIGIFLIVGVFVAIGVAGTILMILYAVAGVVLKSAFGIDLPHPY